MGLMIAGLAVMGFAELFIDPVAMAQITRLNIPGATGVLTGIYAGDRLDRQLSGGHYRQSDRRGSHRGAAMQAYGRIFAQIGWGAAGCALAVIAVLGGWWLLTRRQARTVNA
ncbi:hypothetical protein M8494_01050 [Serratia ureilytica]